MKNISTSIAIIIIGFVFLLTGCSSPDTEPESSTESQQEQTQSAEGEKLVFEDEEIISRDKGEQESETDAETSKENAQQQSETLRKNTVSPPKTNQPSLSISRKDSCKQNGGQWLEDYQECERVSQEWCQNWSGEYNECGSVCRHDPDAKVCTRQCLPYCAF